MPVKSSKKKKKNTTNRGHWRSIFAAFFGFSGFSLLLAQISYLFNWKKDFSALDWSRQSGMVENIFGKAGAFAGYWTVFKGYGVASLLLALLLILTGWWIFRRKSLWKILLNWLGGLFFIGFFSWLAGLLFPSNPIMAGTGGMHTAELSRIYAGYWGSLALWVFIAFLLAVYFFKWAPEHLAAGTGKVLSPVKKTKNVVGSLFSNVKGSASENIVEDDYSGEETDEEDSGEIFGEKETEIAAPEDKTDEKDIIVKVQGVETGNTDDTEIPVAADENPENKSDFKIIVKEEELVDKANALVEQYGEFDPTLELSQYRFPHFGLLKDYDNTQVELDREELQRNNEKIIKALKEYGIDIVSIEANIGPTVTLYEIVPAPGTRIRKIKMLEEDIARSLAALGVRIIAPMPGKNTIGIEVANKKRALVPLKKVLRSKKFQENEMELPIALGKTITNKTFVFDLASMPHLLIAGATGQGKSVGLNVIINSLLFKKHPAELKFVMVDPKKVELSLYNTIEKHFLAKLPGDAEPIISDSTKVKQTLHSLIQEVENRLNLFKKAKVRKIAEYNKKFKERRLNPANGHRFLPYIVLIIDEFADFILTAGKDVQIPLVKLAQISRAVGIHLVIATQRPSVNFITGDMKAQFPGRIAFRVASQIDSRTILDQKGAEKLIGKGDMLFRTDLGITRIQCAYIDTEEVENITNYIGQQPGYPTAYPLPEAEEGESFGGGLEEDEGERDPLFNEAAYIIVSAQQGSASLLQRKLKIGYNRAGRLIDQMERAGIVGPPEGSKPREVYIPDVMELEKFLNKI